MNDAIDLSRLALALGPRLSAKHLLGGEPPARILEQILSEGRTCAEWGRTTDLAAVLQQMRRLIERLEQICARVIFPGDVEYPASLARCARPPGALFVLGHIPLLGWIALVGSRAASMKYVKVTQELAAALGREGWGVVSGGALGIDGAAHQGALTAGCPTVAVLGSGLDQLYPSRHVGLFQQIKECGALITPFSPGGAASPQSFPAT